MNKVHQLESSCCVANSEDEKYQENKIKSNA